MKNLKVRGIRSEPRLKISPHSIYLLWVLALFSALSAISVDLFFPAMSLVKDDFGVSSDLVQGSVYGFFIGLGLAQLIWGNLSDYIGRRPIMLLGIVLYCVSVVGCLLSANIHFFILFRFLQGMSAAVGIIMARTIIRDVYGPEKSAKALATMFLMFSIMPMLLPLIGGYISSNYHWHGVLYAMLAVGVFTLLIGYLFLMETAPVADGRFSTKNRNVLQDYKVVASNALFIKSALVNMLAFSVLLTFVSNSSLVLSKYYRLGPIEIGEFLMFFGACLMLGVVLIRFFLVAKIGVRSTIELASAGLSCGCFVLMSLLFLDKLNLYAAIFPAVILVGASIGTLLTLSAGEALKPFSAKTGTASSLYGFIQHSGASLMGILLSTWAGGEMSMIVIAISLLSVLLLVLTHSSRG